MIEHVVFLQRLSMAGLKRVTVSKLRNVSRAFSIHMLPFWESCKVVFLKGKSHSASRFV